MQRGLGPWNAGLDGEPTLGQRVSPWSGVPGAVGGGREDPLRPGPQEVSSPASPDLGGLPAKVCMTGAHRQRCAVGKWAQVGWPGPQSWSGSGAWGLEGLRSGGRRGALS